MDIKDFFKKKLTEDCGSLDSVIELIIDYANYFHNEKLNSLTSVRDVDPFKNKTMEKEILELLNKNKTENRNGNDSIIEQDFEELSKELNALFELNSIIQQKQQLKCVCKKPVFSIIIYENNNIICAKCEHPFIAF